MMRTNGRSQALFGGLLWGTRPVRYIFVDEAGTSAREKVSVVVGIIANADDHVMSAEALALEVLRGVPFKFREGFKFSAKQIFGDEKFQADWSLTDRLDLLYQMMSVPRRIGMATVVGAHWRGATPWEQAINFDETYGKWGLTHPEIDHFNAFRMCIAVADRTIRRYAGAREVATVVAEDHPTMKEHLKKIPRLLRDNASVLKPEHFRRTESDIAAGHLTQSGDVRVERIRNSVHFVEKEEDPLVQVADACAYGFRRFFNKEKFGIEFVQSILGPDAERLLKDFGPPGGADCWWPKP